MPNRTVYLPGDLSAQAKALGINVSEVLQIALRAMIEARTKRCSQCGQLLPKERRRP